MSVTPPPLNGEPLVTLSQAARKYPGCRGAATLNPSTLTRWILLGTKAPDGRRVRLEAVRVGCRWLTSEAALARFAAALTAVTAGDGLPPARSPVAARRASDRAAAALKANGA
jgi:hypothetical protein